MTNVLFPQPARLVSVAKRKIPRQSGHSQAFLIIFLLTSICVLWHIYTHGNGPIRISFRCLALVSETNGKPRARRSWLAQLATQSLCPRKLPCLLVGRTACQLRPVRTPERTTVCCLCS